MEKILTIVIPAYNTEKYIERCLDSFLNIEVLKELEILIINDGSTDQTPKIAQRYCSKFPSSIRIMNKENGGRGSAINMGIEQATGKYFKVVDADDWVEQANLSEFVRKLRTINADVVANDYSVVQEGTLKVLEQHQVCKNKYHYGKEWGVAEAETEQVIPFCAMTYNTKILQEHEVRVDEDILYEDAGYILYPIPYCKNVYYDATNIYMHRVRKHKMTVEKQILLREKREIDKVLEALLKYYDKNQFIQQYKRKYLEKGIGLIVEKKFDIALALRIKEEELDELIRFDNKMLRDLPQIYAAVKKKHIWAIRHSNYKLFSLCSWIYRHFKI